MRRRWILRAFLDSLEARALLTADRENLGNLVSHGAVCTCPGCLPPRDVPDQTITVRRPSAGESLLVPQLNSDPTAPVKIYLDFDGDAGGSWGGSTVTPTPAFDTNGDVANFDSIEIDQIRQMWKLVTDAFSPFHVNVSTVDPGTLVDGKSVRAVIGGDGIWTGGTYGGIAYIGSFTNSLPNTVWVFSEFTGKGSPDHVGWTGRVITHELGHAFGLLHQSLISPSTGINEDEYDPGTNLTGPLMGYPYSGQRSTWRKGLNSLGAVQDDVAMLLAGGLIRVADDVPTGQSRAVTLSSPTRITGRIETSTDADAYTFTLSSARIVNVRVDPPITGAHGTGTLDAAMRLTGTGVNRDLDTFALGESLSIQLQPGTYTIEVRAGTTNLGYSNLGTYSVAVNGVDAIHSVDMNDSRLRVMWSAVSGAALYVIRASSPAVTYTSISDQVLSTGASTQTRDYQFYGTGIEVVIEAYASAGNLTTPLARFGTIRADMHDLNSNPFRTPTLGDPVEAEDFIAQYVSNTPNPNPISPSEPRTIDLTDQNLGNARHYRPTSVDLDVSTDPTRPGYVLARTQPGEELAYYISNRNAGLYAIEIRYSNPQAGGSMAVRLDSGISNLFNTTVNIPATGSFDTYRMIRTAPFSLDAGMPGFYRMLKIKFLTVSATGSAGNFDSLQLVPVTVLQPPAAPTNLAATYDAAANVVRLTWTDNSNNESEFVVQRRLRGQGASSWVYATRATANGTNAVDAQVIRDTAHEYRVLAVNGTGAGVSSVVSVTTSRPDVPPAAPSNFRGAYDRSASFVRFLWQDNATNELNFTVQRRYRGEGESAWRSVFVGSANSTAGSDSQVIQNVVYEYRVLATNNAGASSSSTIEISTSWVLAPGNLRTAGTVSAGNVNLLWNDNSNNESGFEIQRRPVGWTWSTLGTTGANVATFRDTTAASSVRYEYRARAFGSEGTVPSDFSSTLWVSLLGGTAT